MNLLFTIFLVTSPPVSYEIHARFIPERSLITGSGVITLRNISPFPQETLHLYLYPNAFRSRSTRLAREFQEINRFELARLPSGARGKLTLHRIESGNLPLSCRIDETHLEITPAQPLLPGDSIRLAISFTTVIPELVFDFGRKGRFYLLPRWYPQVAAFDGQGWHTGEFHTAGAPSGAFADYRVTIRFPKGFIFIAPARSKPITDTLVEFQAENITDLPLIAGCGLRHFSDSNPYLRIELFLGPRSRYRAQTVLGLARTICALYSTWFGKPPFSEIFLIDGSGILPQPVFLPGIVILTRQPDGLTRLFERELAFEIARQFFLRNPAPDDTREVVLTRGLPGLATCRYLETTGAESDLLNLPFPIPFLKGVSEIYLNRVLYYLAATNNLTAPLTAPPGANHHPELRTAQAVLTLKTLENQIGAATFDSAVRAYLARVRNRHPTLPGFLATITHLTGPENQVIINRLFAQTGDADLVLKGVRLSANQTEIHFTGNRVPDLPVTLKTTLSDGFERLDTVFPSLKKFALPGRLRVRRVVLDPEGKILEPNRWNNTLPRPVEIRPLLALPSFHSYQIFYGPWFWFDSYRGFQPGIWFAGMRFLDAGDLRGAHNWTLILNYASRRSDLHTGVSYQTPLLFSPFKSRLYISGDNSFRDRGVRIYLLNRFGPPLKPPRFEIDLGYRLYELIDTTGRDPRAWVPGRTAELRSRLSAHLLSPLVSLSQELRLHQGIKPLLSCYPYSKLSFQQNLTLFFPGFSPLSLRLFAGAIFNTTPPQEEFYLSGGLYPTPAEPVSWAYAGFASGQEHWHYDGDVNLRGYSGLYRHGRFAYGVNLHLHPLKFLQPFLDLGNVGDRLDPTNLFPPLLDAGLRLKFGPLYADLPLWKSRPEPGESHFAFRWSLGFKLNELSFGF